MSSIQAEVSIAKKSPLETALDFYRALDPRIPVAAILFSYLVLGLTVLGFNRTPLQVLTTSVSCIIFELLLTRIFKKVWIFPLSALITSFSLSFLLNYSHDPFLLFVPIFFAIGSKYFFSFKGKHALNPAMCGVALSLLLSEELVTAAPAYQWNGWAYMSLFVAALGLTFVIGKGIRVWLVGTFLTTFVLQTALRAWIMKYHLPFSTLFLGTLSSPAFFIFSFFMITDPATSPAPKKDQMVVGFSLAITDLLLHLRQSYYTFFFAALIVGLTRLTWKHLSAARKRGFLLYGKENFVRSGYWKQPTLLFGIALASTGFYKNIVHPHLPLQSLNWRLVAQPSEKSGLTADEQGDLFSKVDPRLHHVIKWILSVGDSVAVGDFDGDGLPDIFLSNPLKKADERATLYRNLGGGKFQPVSIDAIKKISLHPETEGVITQAYFFDYDNDGDQDLFLTVGFGSPRLFRNMLKETGKPDFVDVTKEVGLEQYATSLGAVIADFNGDGLLDIMVLNVWPENLPGYSSPHKLNIFHLPAPEYPGDERMFDFMHDSWHQSNNGGKNVLFMQTPDHHFVKQDSDAIGLPETRWSLAGSAVDVNFDGRPDVYIANDFGPDDFYLNRSGKTFDNIKGKIFGSLGRDTYKGMNTSVADFDRDGQFSVYISNVHHAMQAEGSLFWKFPRNFDGKTVHAEEVASQRGVLNENRFGWGALAVDIDNDGWIDLIQANGMVDDTYDKKFELCKDYWYVNEKVARSPPSIHRFANKWGDLRGYCIYGKERNRVYLNQGTAATPQYVDVAEAVGVNELTNSRGVAAGDFENRGRNDLIITHQFAKPTYYRNEVIDPAQAPSWIGFQLNSLNPICNRDAIGSRLWVTVQEQSGPGWTQLYELQANSGFSAQSDRRIIAGLGRQAAKVDLRIEWCYGKVVEEFKNLKLNQYHQFQLR